MNEKDSLLHEKSKVTLSSQSQAEALLDVTTLPKNKATKALDSSVIDAQWAQMSQDWQSQPIIKTDINRLLKQTKQRTVWAKSLLVIDIMATLAMLFAATYMWLSDSKDHATIIYLAGGGILSIIFVIFATKARLSAWKINCGSPDKAIEHAIVGCQSSISYIKLIKLSCFIIGPFANWYVFAVTEQVEKSPIVGLAILNILLVSIWLVSQHFYIKRQKELKQLNDVLTK
ncbi:hypothetical protein [Colwellia hornerae]|uniref:Uncharacterized protein n=1 Tax=Colwellia hornerae TaxID=89402 RepID=A0A5C6Q305_9GAMM|nr:hypothetical protein [Colwellia hornerae]TWX59438.1 hypothetical protein ESZ28_00385 [Colwellia hornerae]TWX62808.1 hypothetical protein ESZ26_00380 [Colwellia hornerae]TWX63213.1 hypothetical protein ESZ27_17550 [Colwellia hornerae]